MHKKSVQKYSGSLKQAASRVADETLYDVDHETLNEAVAEHLKQAFEATEIRVRCYERASVLDVSQVVEHLLVLRMHGSSFYSNERIQTYAPLSGSSP